MKKVILLLLVAALVVLGLSYSQNVVKATSGTESNYRVPVISPLSGDPSGPFFITRIECTANPALNIAMHYGTPGSRFMDISLGGEVDNGAPVYSSGPGTVTTAGYLSDFGNNVVVENSEVAFRYAHLSKIYVPVGQQVNKGDLIGLIGNTGNSHGSHLHWEAWQKNNSGFNLMSIPGINLTDSTTGQPCTGSNVGTVSGASRFQWNSCPEFYAMGLPNVVVFDHKNCRGNFAVLPGNGIFYLANFDNRTRSIYIPPGKTIIASAYSNNLTNPSVCHTVDMWNVDSDYYDNTSVKVGWDGNNDSTGSNMISAITVASQTICQVSSTTIGQASPGTSPVINTYSWDTGGGTGGQTGNSAVDLFENTNYGATQYGWDNPTNGWTNVPDYMNDKTSSIQLDSGWSIWVAKDSNGGGTRKCLVTSYTDLSGAYYDDSSPMTDTISSVNVFQDSTCGGAYLGTEPGDTVTFWVDPTYWGTKWGVHDPYSGNLPNYLSNTMTSIGVTPGWSAVVYRNSNLGEGFTCYTSSHSNISSDVLNDGYPANDNIESVEVFHDSNCGGRMHAPTVGSFNPQVSSYHLSLTYNISGMAPGYSIHTDFGDSATFDMTGPAINTPVTHDYAWGSYLVVVTVKGTDGVSYPYQIPITVSAPPTATPIPPTPTSPPTSVTTTVNSFNANTGVLNYTLNWTGVQNVWNQCVFGDGPTQHVEYLGNQVNKVDGHSYPVGNFTFTCTVAGLNNNKYVQSRLNTMVGSGQPTAQLPVVTVNAIVQPNRTVLFTVIIANAKNVNHVLSYGSGQRTANAMGNGTKTFTKTYPAAGTYNVTMTVYGLNNITYTLNQQLAIP